MRTLAEQRSILTSEAAEVPEPEVAGDATHGIVERGVLEQSLPYSLECRGTESSRG